MVSEISFQKKSALKTLINIFDKLLFVSTEKQKAIIEQKWDDLNLLSNENQKLNNIFDETMMVYQNKFDLSNNFDDDLEIQLQKKVLKEAVLKYKEVESFNFKLLKDAFFLAKLKVEKIFNKKVGNDTYNRDLKVSQELWDNSPCVLDKII